jgi:hypothetical protein
VRWRSRKATDARVLLPLFAMLMSVTGMAMVWRKTENIVDVRLSRANMPKLLVCGLGVGALSASSASAVS